MKIMRGTLMTTHVDRHGDRMMLSALESALEQIHRTFVPLGVEHDPRIPPQGRLVRASIRKLEDGEYALDGEFELFEPQERVPLGPDDRQIPIRRFGDGEMHVEFDRLLRSELDQQDIKDIATLFRTEPTEEVKKSVDPLAILTVGGAFVLGGIAAGVLSRIGEDAYEALKGKIKAFFERRNKAPEETLLHFFYGDGVGTRGGSRTDCKST
jgi:hypothetical protein